MKNNRKKTFLINGTERDHSESRFTEVDGKTGSPVGDFPNATVQDAIDAADAADAAFRAGWGLSDPRERQRLLGRLLVVLESDYGFGPKSLVAQLVEFYKDLLSQDYAEVLIQNETYSNYAIRAPLGVVAVFVPVNSPLLTGVTGCIPALAAGNTVVLKVPHLKVQEGLDFAHALHSAGFPAGTINVIAGTDPAPSQALVEHPAVRLVSFTGSTATAKKIMASAAQGLKRVHFNLGNKGPALLFADGDWERALAGLLPRMFPGQACSAPSRLLVEESIAERVIERLRILAQEAGPVPLIDEASIKRMEHYVELGRRDGELLFGGSRSRKGEGQTGCWFEPTAIRFHDQASPVCREEVFGPVLSVLTFKSEDEAVQLANDTDFGLIAFAFTADGTRRARLARALQFGTVSFNNVHLLSPHSPWGGFKQSGVGKHYGYYALDEFREVKSIQDFNT